MIEVKGKAGIVAKILADSINEQGNRLVTYELTYPRIIHSELLTHKMLCSNSASSRAIPFAKMAEQLTARPVRFGQANKGMQDKGEDFDNFVLGWPEEYDGNCGAPAWDAAEAWNEAKTHSLFWAEAFYKAGYHKQVYNRLTEPFQMMKTVISGTEWDNFFWLRADEAADPTIAELARCMREAREQSKPQLLKAGQWHLPYVESDIEDGEQFFYTSTWSEDMEGISVEHYMLEEAIKVSCARTAAVSFRNEDYGLEKCLEVYERLIGDERKHASAMQHAATPMKEKKYPSYNSNIVVHRTVQEILEMNVNNPQWPHTWQEGISHADREGNLWSAQYKGWIMHRKTIDGENYINQESK